MISTYSIDSIVYVSIGRAFMAQILAFIFLQLHHYQCNHMVPYHKMKDPTPQNNP